MRRPRDGEAVGGAGGWSEGLSSDHVLSDGDGVGGSRSQRIAGDGERGPHGAAHTRWEGGPKALRWPQGKRRGVGDPASPEPKDAMNWALIREVGRLVVSHNSRGDEKWAGGGEEGKGASSAVFLCLPRMCARSVWLRS